MHSISLSPGHALNFIPERLHNSLTLLRSRFSNSASANLTFEDGTTANKVESSAQPISLFSRMEKSSAVHRRNSNGPKTLPAALLRPR